MAERIQLALARVDAISAAEKVGDDAAATATNIDFSEEPGAATVRRGTLTVLGTATPYEQINGIVRFEGTAPSHYRYVVVDSGNSGGAHGDVYLATALASGFHTLLSSNGSKDIFGASQHDDWLIVAGGTNASYYAVNTAFAVAKWPLEGPGTAIVPTVTTASPWSPAITWSVNEGTAVSGTTTASSTNTGTLFRIAFEGTLASTNTNLSTNGGVALGSAVLDSLEIAFSKPSAVSKVTREYSIGGTGYASRYRSSMQATFEYEALPSAEALVSNEAIAELPDGVSGEGTALSESDRSEILAAVLVQPSMKVTIPDAKDVLSPWAVSRQNFEFLGASSSNSGWADIRTIKVVVEATENIVATIGAWTLLGDEAHPLTDMNVGYAYWETFATLDASGNVIAESGPSPISSRVKCQNASMTVLSTNTLAAPSGAPDTIGPTHRLLYRQGGFATEPYEVGRVGTLTATVTYTDTLSDIRALSIGRKLRPTIVKRSSMPNNIAGIVGNHYDRVFFIAENNIYWSLPGEPFVFPSENYANVTNRADECRGLVSWPPGLVIVNWKSVYELTGNIFEGPSANWALSRTGSRRGTYAWKCVIKTPYGIPLVDTDGLYMYMPGQGVDAPLEWANSQMSDAWKGTATSDPAALKGSRIPAINKGYLNEAVAEWAENKLYFAVPTGTATRPNTVFVLDFPSKKVWWHSYAYPITALCHDWYAGALYAGQLVGTAGYITQLENNVTNDGSPWKVQTKLWTSPSDSLLENLAVEYKGTGIVAEVVYDGTTTALSTLTSSARKWETLPLAARMCNRVQFTLSGTATAERPTIWGVGFDSLPEPVPVKFYRTAHELANSEGEKVWDVQYIDIDLGTGTQTVTAVTFLDNVAVMTNTIVSTASGRNSKPYAFPAESYGKIAYTTFTGTTPFKLWGAGQFDVRPEPPRINLFKSEIQSIDEQICDAVDADINPAGTVLGTVFVDNTAVSTATFTGTNRQSFTHSLPRETYGRTIYCQYSGTAFKHYRTWWHLRPEPDRWTDFVSDKQDGEENLWMSWDCALNPLGATVLGTAYIDGTAVSTATFTGTTRQSFTNSLPAESYGRSIWAGYSVSGTGKFKHFQTWFHGTPEPDRVLAFTSPRQDGEEQRWEAWDCAINPLGGTVTGIAYIDGTAVSTATFTGSHRQSYTTAIPVDVYGRSAYVAYTGTAKFKHFQTWFHSTPEPDRLAVVQFGPIVKASNQDISTWLVDINPLGTAVGTLFVDDVAIDTQTFTGTVRRLFEIGEDVSSAMVPQDGTKVYAVYNASTGGQLKHYATQVHTVPQPFYKRTWLIDYKKLGGATQLDMARFWAIDADCPTGTATLTSIFDLDGVAFCTHTQTLTDRQYIDRIAFPAGARYYLIQQRLLADVPIRIWKVNIDIERVGVKGFSRATIAGEPKDS